MYASYSAPSKKDPSEGAQTPQQSRNRLAVVSALLNFQTDGAAATASVTNAAAASATNVAAASATNKNADDEQLASDTAAFKSDDDDDDVLELARNMQLASLLPLSQDFFDCTGKESPKDWFDKIPGWKSKGQDRGLVRLKGTSLCQTVVQDGVMYFAQHIGLPPVMTGARARHAHKTYTTRYIHNTYTKYMYTMYTKTCTQDMHTKHTQQDVYTKHVHNTYVLLEMATIFKP